MGGRLGGQLVNIRQLRYFLAVAQELNFTRAAERVGIAQPALSQQIIALEQELGRPLFIRDHRRVTLAPAGEILVDHAHRVLNAAVAAVDAIQLAERGARASLSVGAVYSSLYAFLPAVLRAFALQEPLVELNLQEMTVAQQVTALAEGAIEVGLLRGPVMHRDLQITNLYLEPLVLAVPETESRSEGGPIALQEIAGLPLIAVKRQAVRSYSDRVFELFERHELQPNVVHQTQDMHTALCLAAAGLGFSIVPAGVQLLRTTGVKYLPLDEPNAVVSFAFATRKSNRSPLVEEFKAAAEDNASKMIEAHPHLFLKTP